jgi:hypothetical protein
MLHLQKERWDGAWVGKQAAQQVFKADAVRNVLEVSFAILATGPCIWWQADLWAQSWHQTCGAVLVQVCEPYADMLVITLDAAAPLCHTPAVWFLAPCSCLSAYSSCQPLPPKSCLTLTASMATSLGRCGKQCRQLQLGAKQCP